MDYDIDILVLIGCFFFLLCFVIHKSEMPTVVVFSIILPQIEQHMVLLTPLLFG